MERRLPKVIVAGLVEKNGKFLLVKESLESKTEKWIVPGGTVEFGESLEEALVREIKEETNLDIEIERFLDFKEVIATKFDYHTVIFFFLVRSKNSDIKLEQKITDHGFFTKDEINNMSLVDSARWLFDNFIFKSMPHENTEMHMERTLIVIKPDAMKRHLADKIIHYYEKAGLKVIAKKEVHVTKEFAGKHYQATDEQEIGMGNKTINSSKESGKYGEMKEKFGTEDPKIIGGKIRGWLINYISSTPVVAIVFEGHDAVATARKITGFTDPTRADKGTVRGDFGEDSIVKANAEFRPVQNLVHASDKEGAAHELKLWFPELK